jgi:hypothetical protein
MGDLLRRLRSRAGLLGLRLLGFGSRRLRSGERLSRLYLGLAARAAGPTAGSCTSTSCRPTCTATEAGDRG